MKNLANKLTLIFSLLLICLCCSLNANARRDGEWHFLFESIPLELKDITKTSDRIFTGICIKREEIELDEQANLPVVKYTFKVTENIKGVNKKEIIFKQWLPTVNGLDYEIGRKYVLFLKPDSKRGLTSPSGFSQGKYDVENLNKEEIVRNKISSKQLNKNLRYRQQNTSEMGKPIRYKEFVNAVKSLVE